MAVSHTQDCLAHNNIESSRTLPAVSIDQSTLLSEVHDVKSLTIVEGSVPSKRGMHFTTSSVAHVLVCIRAKAHKLLAHKSVALQKLCQ
jgi:hypothetical protein